METMRILRIVITEDEEIALSRMANEQMRKVAPTGKSKLTFVEEIARELLREAIIPHLLKEKT